MEGERIFSSKIRIKIFKSSRGGEVVDVVVLGERKKEGFVSTVEKKEKIHYLIDIRIVL